MEQRTICGVCTLTRHGFVRAGDVPRDTAYDDEIEVLQNRLIGLIVMAQESARIGIVPVPKTAANAAERDGRQR